MISLKAIQKAIDSLTMSTDLTVITEDFQMTVTGKDRSLSHQTVNFKRGHSVPGAVFFGNSKHTLVITPQTAENLNCLAKQIPAVLLKHFRYIAGVPVLALMDRSFYYCHVPDEFQGYDEEGCPIFIMPKFCIAGHIDLNTGQNNLRPKIKRHGAR